MIYVCVTAQNHAASVGLLLWKVRQVFSAFPREYRLLVADDGSSDGTADVLDRYQRALPMTVVRHDRPRGFARSVEVLLREALTRTDRPRRDAAIVLPPGFQVPPDALPDLVKCLESGADLVVGERPARSGPLSMRAVCRAAPWLLRPGIRVPGVRDLLSGCVAVRLATVKAVLRDRGDRLLDSEGLAARAELVARAASVARRVDTVTLPPPLPSSIAERHSALSLAWQLKRAGRRLRVPPPVPPPPAATGPAPAPAVPVRTEAAS
jgi:hypothetical protein